MSHTPGPWITTANGFTVFALDRDGHVSKFIATTAPYKRDQSWEAEANGYLIAAAPEMLELLMQSKTDIAGDWRKRRDAILAKVEGK